MRPNSISLKTKDHELRHNAVFSTRSSPNIFLNILFSTHPQSMLLHNMRSKVSYYIKRPAHKPVVRWWGGNLVISVIQLCHV